MAVARLPPPIRPAGWWYLVPVGVVIVGVVVAIQTLVGGYHAAQDAGLDASLSGPGESQVLTIDEPGAYTVGYAGPILVSTTDEQRTLAQDLQLSIAPADGGAPLPLDAYEGLNDLKEKDQQFVPLLTVRFEATGDYTLRSGSPAGLDPEETRLVVLQSPWRKLRDAAMWALTIVAVALALSVVGTMILARTRGRAKREAASHRGPPPGPWGGHPGYAQPGYGQQGYAPPGYGQQGYAPPGVGGQAGWGRVSWRGAPR